jgi:hypothetical protein
VASGLVANDFTRTHIALAIFIHKMLVPETKLAVLNAVLDVAISPI